MNGKRIGVQKIILERIMTLIGVSMKVEDQPIKIKSYYMKKYFILAFLLYTTNSCSWFVMDVEYNLCVNNSSNYSICDCYLLGINNTTTYPDTLLPLEEPYNFRYEIEANTVGLIFSNPYPIENLFKEYLPSDTLSVFIFHADTVKKYSWEEIRSGYKILKRYDLSLEDLQKCDFTITYP